jgi:NADPH:quinone reductase-like Zn-dependent oxidoreductase
VPGHEVSGRVAAVGPDVAGFTVGDPVFGQVPFDAQGGAAEYVAVPASALALRPDGLSDVDAVTLPVAALTAWEAFEVHAPVGPGSAVLVHAGAGAVGGFAIQLAVLRGATVTTTAYVRDEEVVRALGATTVTTTDPARFGGGRTYDVVIDPLGGQVLEDSYAVVRPGGHLVTLNAPPDQARAAAGGFSATFFVVAGDGAALARIGDLVAAGDLRTTVAATFPLARGREGYTFAGTPGHGPGKTVLVV